jgi:hypothetical protein
MAETPMPVDPQTLLDHQNDAQMRVCADTRCLAKRTTIALVPGQQEYPLPVDVARVHGVSTGQAIYPPLTTDLALRLLSGTQVALVGDLQFYVLGGKIGFIPLPDGSAAGVSVTLHYQARPQPMTALGTYEIGGDYARLVDRRTNCNLFEDDGQIEWQLEEEAFYLAESQRLLRRGRIEQQQRMRVLGWDVAT